MTQKHDFRKNHSNGICGRAGDKVLEATIYMAGGTGVGTVLVATELGNGLLAWAFGGIAIGAAPVIAYCAIAGLTFYMLKEAWRD